MGRIIASACTAPFRRMTKGSGPRGPRGL